MSPPITRISRPLWVDRNCDTDSTSSRTSGRLDAVQLNLELERANSGTASSTSSSYGEGRVVENDNSNDRDSNCGDVRLAADLRVRALLRTRAGLSIPLHPDLVKQHEKDLSATFKALEQTWTSALISYANGLDVVKCDFLLGPQLVCYQDRDGKIHTVPLLDDLEKARDDAREQGNADLADEIDEVINSILDQREELKSVVAKMWGVNGSSPLVFSTDVRNTPNGPRPFIRDSMPQQLRIQAECGEKDDKVVRASMDFALKGYEAFLKSKKLTPPQIEEELAGALDRILKVELTLRDLEGFLEEQKKQQDQLLDNIRARKAQLETDLNDTNKIQAQRDAAQAELVTNSDLEQQHIKIKSRLDQEIEKCTDANRLALHTAAVFSSDEFLVTEEDSSEEDLAKRALSQAEAVVQYVQTEIEEKSKAAAQKADADTSLTMKLYNRAFNNPSHVEQLDQSGIEKSPFAVGIGALLLHTLPPNLEILAYSQFMAEHGCEVKADGIEGSVMQLLLSRDRRGNGKEPSESVSPDLQKTMRLLQGCGVPKTDTQRFVSEAKAKMDERADLGDVQSLDASKLAVMALIIEHEFTPISPYGNSSIASSEADHSDKEDDGNSDARSQGSIARAGGGGGAPSALAVQEHLSDDDSDAGSDDGQEPVQTVLRGTLYNAASVAGNLFGILKTQFWKIGT